MDFMDVISALEIIKRHCKETPDCKQCRLHSKDDVTTCGVSPKGTIPARWEFDLDAEIHVPSIFK